MPYTVSEIQKKRQERVGVGEQLRSLLDKARSENRELDATEQETKKKLFDRGLALKTEIEEMEMVSDLLADDHPLKRSAPATAVEDPKDPTEKAVREATAGAEKRNDPRNSPEYRALFRQYLQAGNQVEALEVASRAREFRAQHRDLQVDNDQQAGILVPPVEFVKEILKDFDDEVMVRRLARVVTVRQAKALGIFKRLGKVSTFRWGSELGAPSKDTTLRFGARELHPHDAVGEIVVSRPWLKQSDMNPEAIIREELARDAGELMEQGFLTGSGAGNEPLGVFTASPDGISTARDVSTGNTATAVTLNGLRAAKYALKPAWWKTASWMGGRTFHEQISALAYGDGRPIFKESDRVGEPDRVLNLPIVLDEWCPSTFTTGLYVGILGDWARGYMIADALDPEIERFDDSAYARTNQVGFIARLKTDGMPVLEEAFVRVKLG